MTDLSSEYFWNIACELIKQWMNYNYEAITDFDIAEVFSSDSQGLYVVLVGGRQFEGYSFKVFKSESFCLEVLKRVDAVYKEYKLEG